MRRIFNLALMALAVNFLIVSCKKNENVEDLPLPTLKFNPENSNDYCDWELEYYGQNPNQ